MVIKLDTENKTPDELLAYLESTIIPLNEVLAEIRKSGITDECVVYDKTKGVFMLDKDAVELAYTRLSEMNQMLVESKSKALELLSQLRNEEKPFIFIHHLSDVYAKVPEI